MNQLNAHKTALTLGLLLGGFHAVWAVLVLLGVAQMLMDFVLWAHMVHMEYTVGPFDLTATLTLVVMTAAIGYVLGWVFAYLWNRLHATNM